MEDGNYAARVQQLFMNGLVVDTVNTRVNTMLRPTAKGAAGRCPSNSSEGAA